jgi:hypothetical protein
VSQQPRIAAREEEARRGELVLTDPIEALARALGKRMKKTLYGHLHARSMVRVPAGLALSVHTVQRGGSIDAGATAILNLEGKLLAARPIDRKLIRESNLARTQAAPGSRRGRDARAESAPATARISASTPERARSEAR